MMMVSVGFTSLFAYSLYLIYEILVGFLSFIGLMNTLPTSPSAVDNDLFLFLFICGAVSFIASAVLWT